MKMGRGELKKKKQGKTKKSKASSSQQSTATAADDALILVDPSRIRFQYSRIRPYFSGCGRSIESTLESIRRGEMSAGELPPIQVMVGPDEQDGRGPWYFSLNNRRLWVLKRCKEEGLLEGGLVGVRVREPKSRKEAERYTLKNCAVEAKFIREKDPNAREEEAKARKPDGHVDTDAQHVQETDDELSIRDQAVAPTVRKSEPDDNESSESSDDEDGYVNRFSLLM